MNDLERTKRINELFEKIQPLKFEQTLIQTKLHSFNNSALNDDEKEKKELNSQLLELKDKLSPLIEELRSKQIRYFVNYDAEITSLDRSKYTENYQEILYFTCDYDIDTDNKGWEIKNNDINKQNLLNEIIHFLYYYRFSAFVIKSIKKLS